MNAKQSLASLFLGALFGVGLMVSGMMQPQKVHDFLDFTGSWDPSLALVMGGAIGVALPAFALSRRRERGWLGARFDWPRATQIDRRLLLGGALFGVGWGMAGVCPGPALVLLGAGVPQALGFVAAMLAGMWLVGKLWPAK